MRDYDPIFADEICEEIANSQDGLKAIVDRNTQKNKNFPSVTTIRAWIRNIEEFRNKYTRAKEDQADLMVEEMLEISDYKEGDILDGLPNSVAVARAKLRVDTRKFIASKLRPKKYGEHLDITTDGEKINQVQIYQIPDNERD